MSNDLVWEVKAAIDAHGAIFEFWIRIIHLSALNAEEDPALICLSHDSVFELRGVGGKCRESQRRAEFKQLSFVASIKTISMSHTFHKKI